MIKPSAAESGIKVDNTQYSVYVGHPAQVKITGKITGAIGGNVILTITKPDGTSQENTAFVTKTGDFTSLILLDKNSQLGQYQISASYNGAYVGSASFDVAGKESQQTTPQSATGYKTYQNTQYGFSIKHPSWWQEQEVLQKTSHGFIIEAFSPSKTTGLAVAFSADDKVYGNLQGQKYLNKMIESEKDCEPPSCSNFKVGESNIYAHPNGYLEYVLVYSVSQRADDGTTSDVVRIIAQIPNGKDTWLLLIQTTANELKQHLAEISSVTSTFTILDNQEEQQTQKSLSSSLTQNTPTVKDYSNYSLLKGEWIKYKMYLKTQSNDKSLQQTLQDALTQQFSGIAGQQVKSIDDIDWIKSTVTNVSTDEIKIHTEAQVLGKHSDLGDVSLEKSPSFAIPRNAKVGDTFDSMLSSAENPNKVTVTAIKKANILGNNVDVIELTSSKTIQGDTMTIQTDQTVHYDTKTGILLGWSLQMKLYNTTKSVTVQFGMTPIEWSELLGASAQAPTLLKQKQNPTNPSLQQSSSIPSWIKNTAKWWSQGSIGDDDFIKGIQYLIQQGIIVVPTTQVSSQSSQAIPAWVKNTVKWWSEGQVTDSDFVNGIQYLIQNGIIAIQAGEQQASAGILSGATFHTGPLPQPEMVTYTDKDGITLSVLAIPGEVMLFVLQDANLNDVNQAITGYGGTILSKIPVTGYYEVQVNDVSKFISNIHQKSFVMDASPIFVLSPDQNSPNLPNIIDLANYKTGVDISAGAKNPDPSSKVIIAVIDNFNGCYVLKSGSHGCHVINEILAKTPDASIMAIQYDGGKNLAKNIAAAIQTAKDHAQKMVINLSMGIRLTDKDGNVVSNAQEKYTKDIKSILNMLNDKWVEDGNVIFVKSAGNDNVEVSKAIQQIKDDKDVGQRFEKMFILAGQLDKDTQKPMEYANNRGSNHGKGILYDDKTTEECSTGTSCTAPNVVAATATIWNTNPKLKSGDIRNGIINSAKKEGNYHVLSPQDALNSITKCLPSCPQISYNTGESGSNAGTTTSGGRQQPTTNTPTTQGGYNSKESYCQGTYGSKYHYDSSTNKCTSSGGYDSKESYCQGTYGSKYHYDSSRNVCAPSSGSDTSGGSGQQGGTTTSGINLSGRWEGSTGGTVIIYDVNAEQLTCQFGGHITLVLTQTGNRLEGNVIVNGISLSGAGCEQAGISEVSGFLSSTIFGSGFSGNVDNSITVNGQFTSDLMRGRYSGNEGGYSISGDFTTSRAR